MARFTFTGRRPAEHLDLEIEVQVAQNGNRYVELGHVDAGGIANGDTVMIDGEAFNANKGKEFTNAKGKKRVRVYLDGVKAPSAAPAQALDTNTSIQIAMGVLDARDY